MNGFAIGFGAVAVVAVIGVDYFSQAQAAGPGAGSYSLGAYAASVGTRFGDLTARAEVPEVVPARTHLPAAPDGWERRAWSPANDGTYDESGEDPLTTEFMAEMNDNTLMRAAKGWMDGKENARAEQDVWEYVGPVGTIRLSARLHPTTGEVFRKKLNDDPHSVNVKVRQGTLVELGDIAGVTYYVGKRDEFDSSGTLPLSPPIFVRGYIGDDVVITGYAEGNHATLIDLLEAIDYDALNAMQDSPARGIGSDAQPLSDAQRRLLVIRAGQLEAEAKAGKRQAAAARAPAAKPAQKDKAGGFFSGLGDKVFGTDASDQDGPKRLSLTGDKCESRRTGKFCGVD